MTCLSGFLVLHGPSAWAIATRLAMDLRSDGVQARPVGVERISAADWEARLPGVEGLVVVYDGRTWIQEPMYSALFAISPDRPVVFVRSRSSRFAPDFMQFLVVPLFDDTTFNHYQPQGLSGYKLVVEALGIFRPPRDARRRGFAFVSYAGTDKQEVHERLVPALAANDVGFFDYRFTARLNERRLEREIERRVQRSAVLVLYATNRWPASPYTALERALAEEMGRPIVAVLPSDTDNSLDFGGTHCRFEGDAESNASALRSAIEQAIGAKLPSNARKRAKRDGAS